MNSITSPRAPSPSIPASPASSERWLRLCAEQLSGIADPLFPALARASAVPGPAAARAILGGLAHAARLPDARDELPAWLLPHQADAVSRARAILARFGGVLVADAVGLGKTYVGLALAILERRDGGETVALVPSAVLDEWCRAADAIGLRVALVTHERLGRGEVTVAPDTSLILVDEAHAFRNPRTRRYDALARLTLRRRVVLLSATPYNNAPADLAALLHLFAPRDRFRELGVTDYVDALRGGATGPVALALGAISVCRTRRAVEDRFTTLRDRFPTRTIMPAVRYDLDGCYGAKLGDLLAALEDLTRGLATQETAAALIHLSLLRRLESCRSALRRSLLRHRDFLTEVQRATECGRSLSRAEFRRTYPRGDADDLQLVLWPLLTTGGAGETRDSSAAVVAVGRALAIVDAAAEDPKLAALIATLQERAPGTRTLVFTEYRDTALYLLRALRTRFRVLGAVGREGWAGGNRIARREALDVFAPGRTVDPLLEADVLVATDVAAEGLNLQSASQVLNYDLPWNPVRVMQRIGRIDRLGSPHQAVQLGHIVPGGGWHSLTTVLQRLRTKLHGMQATIGAEPDPLAPLWWLDSSGEIGGAAVREAASRFNAFEAAERWCDHAGVRGALPVVGAVVATDLHEPATGLLLELVWASGTRVPLAYVVRPGGGVTEDPLVLGTLAEQALHARPVPADASHFVGPIATVLGRARARLLEVGAARHVDAAATAERRAALRLVERAAAAAAMARAPLPGLDRAASVLGAALTAGQEREVAAVLRHGATDGSTVPRLVAALADFPVRTAAPERAPRLDLVAALAVLTVCPSR